MADTKIDFEAAKAKVDGPSREHSTIYFPNVDLAVAADLARAVYGRHGLGTCPLDELAAELKCTMSGHFRNRTSAARQFGFIERDGRDAVKLTDLGCHLLSPESEADAMATAFLNVPLYNRIYETYRGKLLPPVKALEREMHSLGVVLKQAAVARQIFQRSARQAGFSASGDDRLVRPKTANAAAPPEPAATVEQAVFDAPRDERIGEGRRVWGGGNGGTGGGGRELHPFVQGLLASLPEPETNWAVEGRAKWLQAAANIFDLMYKGDGDINVTASPPKNGAAGS